MTNLTSDDILALQADFGTLSLAAAEAIVTLRADRNQALAFHAQACDAARVLKAERDALRAEHDATRAELVAVRGSLADIGAELTFAREQNAKAQTLATVVRHAACMDLAPDVLQKRALHALEVTK